MSSESDSHSQRPLLSNEGQPPLPSRKFWKTFLKKMAITGRLLGKEILRNKLRWLDLRRADYQLGRKTYETRVSLPDQNRIIDRLDRIQNRTEALSQAVGSGPSFKEKSIGVMKGVGRAMTIQTLNFRRNRLFRKLGNQIRKSTNTDSSLATEIDHSKAVSQKIKRVDSDIDDLAAGTYFWARRPLLTGSLVIILMIVFAGIAYEQESMTPDLSTPRKTVQAFEAALERNDMTLARSLAFGNEQGLALAKMRHDFTRTFYRMQLARAKHFGGERMNEATDDYDTELAKADERIEGDKATLATLKLEKAEQTWKIDLRGSESALSTAQVAAVQRLIQEMNEITDKIEKGYYKTNKEVEAELSARLAAASTTGSPQPSLSPVAATEPPQAGENSTRQTSKLRSEDSLAVERYLRARLVGGLTENQIIDLSDAIAAKFDAADLPSKEREWYFSGIGDKRQIELFKLYEVNSSGSSASSEVNSRNPSHDSSARCLQWAF
jgi:hypothetical protein